MTESEWLAYEDAKPMLKHLRSFIPDSRWGTYSYLLTRGLGLRLKPTTTSRKLRLFAVACSSYNSARMMEQPYRNAVEVGERFADGEATQAEMESARELGAFAATFDDPVAAATLGARMWTEGLSHVMAAFLRDIIGNPFRIASVEPAWLAWNDGAIKKLAQIIYDDRSFNQLPFLADALEDAGCADATILSHCREPGEHVRGCWVVDLLLDRK